MRLVMRLLVWLVRASLASPAQLVIENAALRQQLAMYCRQRPQPRTSSSGYSLPAGGAVGVRCWRCSNPRR